MLSSTRTRNLSTVFNIYFKKFDVHFFNKSKFLKQLYNMSLRRLPSQHGEVSVMNADILTIFFQKCLLSGPLPNILFWF